MGKLLDATSCIVFSIPRSGTHIVMGVLAHLGFREYKEPFDFKAVPPRGHYTTSVHRPARQEFVDMFGELGFKGVLIQRDFRDSLVSMTYFSEGAKSWCRAYPSLRNMDFDDRLMSFINGIPEEALPSIAKWYETRTRWRDVPRVHFTEFESFITNPKEEITKIGMHVGVEVSPEILSRCQSNLKSSRGIHCAFRKGVVGDWKTHFKLEHKEAFKELAGDILIREGYESNMNW